MQGVLLAVALAGIVAGAVLLTLARVWWFPPLASNWGALDTMINVTVIVTGVAFIAVNLFIAYAVYKYRRRDGHRAFFLADNPRLEWILVWVTALGIVVLLAPGLAYYARVISPPRDALVVEVLAQQWLWSYRYPGRDGVLGRTDINLVSPTNPFGLDPEDPAGQDDVLAFAQPLRLPVGQPVLLRLRAIDVLHSFYVPEFRVKMDAVPGMVTQMWFTPTRVGTYQVVCAEFCGIGHYNMLGQVLVMEARDFEAWLQGQPTRTGSRP